MKEVKRIFAHNTFGMRFFEIHFRNEDGSIVDKSVNLSTLKELNVTKTMNGFKKVRTWAESEEGQKFLFESEDK